MKLTEKELKQMIRQVLKESFGPDPLDPRHGGIPEEPRGGAGGFRSEADPAYSAELYDKEGFVVIKGPDTNMDVPIDLIIDLGTYLSKTLKEANYGPGTGASEYSRDVANDPFAPEDDEAWQSVEPSPEGRAVLGGAPEFKKFLVDAGLDRLDYETVVDALLSMGLDRKTAGQYAMFASDEF